jgi:hypothetical protein
MIFKVSNLHKFFFTYICPRFYGGSPPSTPSQTTQTVNQNTIPAELMPYVKNMLNRAEPLSQSAYVPYSTNAADYVAPFSPLQKQAQAGAANLQTPSQFAPATQMAGVSGIGQLGTAGQALGYGAQGAGYGQTAANVGAMGGLGYGAQSADLGMQAAGMAGQGYGAGAQYAQQATSPTAIGAYMNPYLQQSLAPQLQLLNQQYGIKQAQQQGAATQAGAFGGSREALQGGLINQGQALAQQEMIAQGYNQAFGQAQQAQQFGANLGLQGMQAGNQAMQTGLQGLGQGLTGVNTALQGYQQGMAGSQAGLAGVQGAQQGFTGAANTAATLGNLGTAQLGAETSVLGTQAQFGAQQQAQQQQAIDQAVLNYQNAQQYPYMQLGFMSNLLRGTPINNTTETQYMAQPSAMQQIGGALGTAGSLYGAYTAKKAEGGRIQDNSYAKGGIVGYLEGGSVEESMRSKLEDLDISHLQQIIQSNESPEMSKLAKEVLATKFAKGGIVAFANGGQSQDWKSALENISQEMTARDYKLHGWTDEDIINYKSSGRVPLDPKKQLALRTPEAAPRIPLDKDIYYNRLQEKGRRVPEDKVIRLPDENAVKPNTFEPVSSDKGIAGYRPAAEYEPPQYGGELGAPPKEGEYIPSEKSTARGAIGAPEQEPIEGRKMYYDETKAYKDAMEQRRADMARGKKPPMNAGMAREELLKKKKMGMEATVERPEGATADVAPKPNTWTEEPVGNFGEKVREGIKGVGSKAKSIAKGLMSAEVLVPLAMEERAAQFKTGEGDALTKGIQGIQAGPSVALEALQRAVLGGSTAEEFRKASPKLAAFIDETGKTVEDRFNAVKDYFTGELSAEDKAQPSRAEAQQVATEMGVPAQTTPFVSEGLNAPNVAPSVATPTPPQPPMGLGSSAPAGVAPPAQQPSFGGTPEESEILRANLASEPESVAQAVNTAAEVTNAKTEQEMGFYQKQVAEMYKQAGLGNNEGAAAMRKEIMDELANKEANEKRQTYLRMAEFFSHWGSTPGAPLAAGMKSLIATMPGYLEDKKDQEKLQRGLQDSLYKLDQADRLEKIGMIKEAAALKHEASQFDKEVMKLQHEAVQNRLQEAAAERRAKIMAGASITGDVIRATSRIDGTVSDTYRGNNIKALQNQATNITRQMANLLPESKELPGLKAQLKNVNDRMDALIDESGAKPKTRYDRWLTETGKI